MSDHVRPRGKVSEISFDQEELVIKAIHGIDD